MTEDLKLYNGLPKWGIHREDSAKQLGCAFKAQYLSHTSQVNYSELYKGIQCGIIVFTRGVNAE